MILYYTPLKKCWNNFDFTDSEYLLKLKLISTESCRVTVANLQYKYF